MYNTKKIQVEIAELAFAVVMNLWLQSAKLSTEPCEVEFRISHSDVQFSGFTALIARPGDHVSEGFFDRTTTVGLNDLSDAFHNLGIDLQLSELVKTLHVLSSFDLTVTAKRGGFTRSTARVIDLSKFVA